MSQQLILRLVSSAISISNKAGVIVRDIMKSGKLGIVDKGVNDLQTEADRMAQKFINASFIHQFPSVTVIGEETLNPDESIDEDMVLKDHTNEATNVDCPPELHDINLKDVVIWVDPLDGTSEYTQGLLDHVTVLIGISVKGKSVAGVIHQPFYNYENEPDFSKLGRTMWGIIGAGIHGIEFSQPPQDKRILTTTRSHLTPEVTAALDAMNPTEILKVGGAGHKVLLLIEGKAHAYVFASPGCKKWDTCAPEALLHAVGGYLTDIHGSVYQYHEEVQVQNKGGVLATAIKADHAWYLKQVPEAVRNKIPV